MAIPGRAARQAGESPWVHERADAIAAARQKGIPITLADLRGPAVPDDQNAATYFARLAADKLPPSAEEATCIDALLSQIVSTSDVIARGRHVLAAHKERLRLIHQAAGCTSFSVLPETFKRNGADVIVNDFPLTGRLRDYARWLYAEGVIVLADGKPLEAVKTVALGFNLGRLVALRPGTIPYLVGTAINALARSGLRVILYRAGDDAGVAEAVRSALAMRPSMPMLSEVLKGEAVSGLMLIGNVRRELPRLEKLPVEQALREISTSDKRESRAWRRKFGYPSDTRLAVSRYLDRNESHYLEWMCRLLPLIDLPPAERAAAAEAEAIGRESDKLSHDPDYMVAALLIGSVTVLFDKMPTIRARDAAAADVLQAGAAVLAYKDRTGHLPEGLAEAMESVPVDPFGEKPLGYRSEGAGFVVYSAGPTGKFDGGRPGAKSKGTESLFRYPPPAIHVGAKSYGAGSLAATTVPRWTCAFRCCACASSAPFLRFARTCARSWS
jgi:hypothetical protein